MSTVKKIYFIRHGETEANKMHIHQNADETLTSKGKLQAHHVAHILEGKKIDALLCSPYVRARETAQIISEQLSLPYTTEGSVVEIRRPDHLYGQGYYSWQTLAYMWKLFIHRENPEWEHNGAENMYTLRNRIQDAKNHITQTEGASVAVVSHDLFMNLFLEHICREKKLSLLKFLHVLFMSKKTPNTCIIHVEFNPSAPKGVCAWQLIQIIDPHIKVKT